jgi:hypothetical protein
MERSELTRFDLVDQNIEFFINEETGQAYASIRAVARMTGKSDTAIRRWIGAQNASTFDAQVPTHGGLQGAKLLPSESVFEAALKFCPELAKKMGLAGANLYICGMAGYEIKIKQKATLEQTKADLERQLLPTPTQKELKGGHGLYKLMYGKAYADRWLQSKVKAFYPALAPSEQPAPEERQSLPTAKALLTPTAIAKELGWVLPSGNGHAIRVNKLIAQLGYQEKVGGQWSATAKAIMAKLCDRKPVDTNSKTQKDQLLWSAEIVSVLKEHAIGGIHG